MIYQEADNHTVWYEIMMPEEANTVYREPNMWDSVKQKWEQIIQEEVSKCDTQIDEHSGLIETIEQNMKQILHDDIQCQRTNNARRLRDLHVDRLSELERLQNRLAEVQEQKEILGEYLKTCEAERRKKS